MDSVSSSDHVVLSWRITAFMQMTPHTYNVTRCSDTCETLLIPYDDNGGAALMNVSISGLSLATPTSIQISSSVVRTDSLTGRNTTLQSRPVVLQVRAGINNNTNETTTTDNNNNDNTINTTIKLRLSPMCFVDSQFNSESI